MQHPVDYEGQGLPKLIAMPCVEMLNASNLSFALCPPPKTITLDGSAALHRAVREMKEDGVLPEDTKVRSSKYLDRARSSQYQVKDERHAWFQAIQEHCDHAGGR